MDLGNLFKRHGCDKADHCYHALYQSDFEELRKDHIKLLEIGIWKGTSLKAWKDYFPNGEFYGIDIFTRITPQDVPVLKEHSVYWAKGDSTVDLIPYCWGTFDIIIDDGKHTPRANADTFKNNIDRLMEQGVYYIEDVWPLDRMTKKERESNSWLRQRKDEYSDDAWNYFIESLYPYEIERFDFRKQSGKPDSYIFKITK